MLAGLLRSFYNEFNCRRASRRTNKCANLSFLSVAHFLITKLSDMLCLIVNESLDVDPGCIMALLSSSFIDTVKERQRERNIKGKERLL
jgi:uncharacterized membrane protein